MTDQSSEDITLVELLEDEDMEFVIYNDGQEVTTVDGYGEALSAVLNAIDHDIGVEQAVGAGMSRSVYLDPEGVIETLLDQVDTTDN